jgi:hypothetical protein
MSVRFQRGASYMLLDEVYIGGRIRASSARRDPHSHDTIARDFTFRMGQSAGVGAEAGLLRANLGWQVAGTQYPGFRHMQRYRPFRSHASCEGARAPRRKRPLRGSPCPGLPARSRHTTLGCPRTSPVLGGRTIGSGRYVEPREASRAGKAAAPDTGIQSQRQAWACAFSQ